MEMKLSRAADNECVTMRHPRGKKKSRKIIFGDNRMWMALKFCHVIYSGTRISIFPLLDLYGKKTPFHLGGVEGFEMPLKLCELWMKDITSFYLTAPQGNLSIRDYSLISSESWLPTNFTLPQMVNPTNLQSLVRQ